MRKIKGRSFKDLVSENKRELLKDEEAMNKIEERLEKRAQARFM